MFCKNSYVIRCIRRHQTLAHTAMRPLAGVAPPRGGGLGGSSLPSGRVSPPPTHPRPPSGNLKISVGVMIFTKPFNVRDRLDRIRQSFFFAKSTLRVSVQQNRHSTILVIVIRRPRQGLQSGVSRAYRRPEVTKNVRSFGLKHAIVNPWTYQTESHEDHK